MKKYTFEQAKERILNAGFQPIESPEEKGIIILGTFGLNYCSCCKRSEGTIVIYNEEKYPQLWISGSNDGGFTNDPLCRETLRCALRELGVKSKLC